MSWQLTLGLRRRTARRGAPAQQGSSSSCSS